MTFEKPTTEDFPYKGHARHISDVLVHSNGIFCEFVITKVINNGFKSDNTSMEGVMAQDFGEGERYS